MIFTLDESLLSILSRWKLLEMLLFMLFRFIVLMKVTWDAFVCACCIDESYLRCFYLCFECLKFSSWKNKIKLKAVLIASISMLLIIDILILIFIFIVIIFIFIFITFFFTTIPANIRLDEHVLKTSCSSSYSEGVFKKFMVSVQNLQERYKILKF